MKDVIRIVFLSQEEDGQSCCDHARIEEYVEHALNGERVAFDSMVDPSLMTHQPDLVLLHLNVLNRSDEERLAAVIRRWPDVPVVGVLGEQRGGAPMFLPDLPAGLRDFILCPVDGRELALRVRRVLTQNPSPVDGNLGPARPVRIHSLVGESAIFQAQVEKIPLFANVDAPVLLQGETGTGKEVFARAIHYSSARKDHAFIPINCAALPDQLFENELFGHAKGAYTSAAHEQGGLVLEAEGGTLFLDEVDALNSYAQAKLLRFVQYREYRPLGYSRTKLANVRIIAASNLDLRQAVANRQFREDLFHRLNVLSLVVPPLRDRAEDIPLLAKRFLQRFRRAAGQGPRLLSDEAIQKLLAHVWPGNVRELESALQRAVVMCASATIQAQDIECPGERSKTVPLNGSLRAVKNSATMDAEKAYLVKTLVTFRGNVTHAAKAAGKERRSFQRLLRKYGLDRQAFMQNESGPVGTYPPPLHQPFDGHA